MIGTVRGYELRQMIGEGGFGTVYQAYQPVVDREVAIKIILPERASQPTFIRNFEAEAQLIARLEHLHIVPLYDFWRDPDGAYLVMRWLRGGNLHRALAQQGAMNLGEIARLLDQICAALATAHRNGIIHRDIKPANILLDTDGNAYLSDFGIAMDIRRNPKDDMKFFGSPAYMSPEQYSQQILSPQGDIYSMGIVLYELLTGRYPYSITDMDSMYRHMQEPLPSVRAFRHDLSAALDTVVLRAAAKSMENRYGGIIDLAIDFRRQAGLAVMDGQYSGVTTEGHSISDITPPDPAMTLDFSTTSTRGMQTISVDIGQGTMLEPRNPYKGLRSFEEADAADFYGRDELVQQLLDHLKFDDDAAHFVAVIGPSGSGKSSAVKAGLVPALRDGQIADSEHWFIAQMTPGPLPFTALREALERITIAALHNITADKFALHFALANSLPYEDSTVFLYIDQFEELFSQSLDESARTLFLECLLTAIGAGKGRLRVVISLRADYYDRPLHYPDLAALMRQHSVIVVPMGPEELQQAINAPAEQAGLTVEPALVRAMIDDLREQPGALPLLQFALAELFERREASTLTMDAYRQIGGVSGALAMRADELYASLDDAEQKLTQQMFLRLVTLGENADDTRRRVLQSELEAISNSHGVIRQIIDRLGKHRLLTIDRDPVTRAPTVEVAHEALIRQWGYLRTWLDENRDWLRLQRQLALAAQDWQRAGEDESFLASGSRLSQYETLLDAPVALTPSESAYIRASIRLRKRTERRRSLVIATLIAFSLIAFTLALLALYSQQRANQEAAIARSRELAVTALIDIGDQLDTALLLSGEALDTADTLAARNSLLTALQAEPQLVSYLHGSTEALRALAINPRGQILAAAGRDMQIHLWNLETRQPVGPPLSGHEDWINALAFHPDGRLLASGAVDRTIQIWDTETGQPMDLPVLENDDEVWALAFTPDGQTLISGAANGMIRLWDVESGDIKAELDAHDDLVFDLAVMPDGRHFVSASADQSLRVWDTDTLESVSLLGHDDWVLSVAVHPDGELIASGGADNKIVLWDIHSGEVLATLSGHSDWVRDLAFNPDGTLASASADGTVRLWDTVTGQETQHFGGHKDAVWAVGFVPDTWWLISAGADARLLVWDIAGGLSDVFAQQFEAVDSLALSPDGSLLASASGDPSGNGIDNSVYLWDLASGLQRARLEGHERTVTSVAFSPDGRQLLSASVDETIIRWDVASASMLGQPLTMHNDAVMQVAYRPDGEQWASAGFDRDLQLWDADTDTPTMSLNGHTDAVLALAYSPDNRMLASGGFDRTIRLWDVATGEAIGEAWTQHGDAVTSLTFSADGRSLLSTSRDGSAILWDVASGVARSFIGHDSWVLSAAFHPTQPWIVTGSRDNTIILWDMSSSQMLGLPFRGHSNWVSVLRFDGETLYSGSYDGSVRHWSLNLAGWVARARLIANRDLSTS